MRTFIKQLFCHHEYEKINNRHHMKHRGYIVVVGVYRCKKCGKVVVRE